MNKVLAIIGCGNLGQQIAHFALHDRHYKKAVFFDDFTNETAINGHSVVGKTDEIEMAFQNQVFDELLIGIGYSNLLNRQLFYEKFEKTIPFGTIIHSSCWVDPEAVVKPGTVVYPRCCIDAKAEIGNNIIVNLSSIVAHDSKIGDHSFISANVAVAGCVTIGTNCFIGISTTIIDNVSLISGTKTGGGTVVIKNIVEPGWYVGNPARKMSRS